MISKHLKGCSGPASVTLFGSFPFLDTFVSKIRENVSRNRRNDKKCLEIGENVFSNFWTLFGLEIREKLSRNRKNNIK